MQKKKVTPKGKKTLENQFTENYKNQLEHQQYRIVGNHSAVKICGWTKNLLRGRGGCYKLKFYGIKSHQCLQMTTSLSCANRCEFCWRGTKAPVSKEWKWGVDEPKFIIEESIKAQLKLLTGFNGNPATEKDIFEQSLSPKHVALSLTGEPICYPKINEICKEFHKRGISTFIVTNAQYPKEIKKLNTITQLYLSLDAPNKEILKKVDKPLFLDYWERYLASLKEVKKKKFRKAARLTIIKGINDIEAENYAELILKGDFDFVEVKGYMFVGESRQRLEQKNMPLHEEVKSFAQEVLKFLPKYELCSEHKPSRVVLLTKKKFNKNTWINFAKFFELVNKKSSPKNLDGMKYTTKTMKVKECTDDEEIAD